MMAESLSYIAGIGRTSWGRALSWLPPLKTTNAAQQLAISAGTKALLDAGVSYDDVDYAVSGGNISGQDEIFYAFGKTGVPAYGVEAGAGLFASVPLIRRDGRHCILVIDVDEVGATGIVLVSEAYLWRHPYLKDSAVAIRGCARRSSSKTMPSTELAVQEVLGQTRLHSSDFQLSGSNSSAAADVKGVASDARGPLATSSLSSICELVWLLRGWGKSSDTSIQHRLHCIIASRGTATVTALSRADGRAAPTSEDAKHKNDGRDRLGYNPAIKERDIAFEDWEASKARPELSDERVADKIHFRRRGGDRAALSKL